MKKRGPPLSTIKDGHALYGIWLALEGDPSWLARSLRNGRASTAEQKVAADLIEGKIKPRRPRTHGSQQETRLRLAQKYASIKKYCVHLPKWERQKKELKLLMAREFGVSVSQVEKITAEFDDESLSAINRIYYAKAPASRILDRDTLDLLYEKFLHVRK